MPIRPSLVAEITNALATFSSLNVSAANHPWDLYEGYVFALVVQAARRVGATVSFENILGAPTTAFIFRTSPTSMYRPRPPRIPILYTHAVLSFSSGKQLEVHQGVYVTGKSGLPHECDVAVIDRAEGISCRASRAHPRGKKTILAAECKFYATLNIALARGFIGLTSDLANHDRFFVANTTYDNLERLLTHHMRLWSRDTIPNRPIEVNRLRALFENALLRYLSRS